MIGPNVCVLLWQKLCAVLTTGSKGEECPSEGLDGAFLAQPVSLYSGTFAPFYQDEYLFVRVRRQFDVKSFSSEHRRRDFSCAEVQGSLYSGQFGFTAFIFASLIPTQ